MILCWERVFVINFREADWSTKWRQERGRERTPHPELHTVLDIWCQCLISRSSNYSWIWNNVFLKNVLNVDRSTFHMETQPNIFSSLPLFYDLSLSIVCLCLCFKSTSFFRSLLSLSIFLSFVSLNVSVRIVFVWASSRMQQLDC